MVALLVLGGFYLSGDPADASEPGDYFLLALSWVPSWCAAEGDARNAAQCDTDAGWLVHGLWPQYADGGWPEVLQQTKATQAGHRPVRCPTSWAMAGLPGINGKSTVGAAG